MIVFGGGSILETGGGKMVRAAEQAKQEQTNLSRQLSREGDKRGDALERAIMIKDRTGVGASAIYFLTDGFE